MAAFLGYLVSCPLFVSGRRVWCSLLPGIGGGAFSEVILAHSIVSSVAIRCKNVIKAICLAYVGGGDFMGPGWSLLCYFPRILSCLLPGHLGCYLMSRWDPSYLLSSMSLALMFHPNNLFHLN